MSLQTSLSFIFFLLVGFATASNSTVDPFTDPKHDPNNPLRYIASNVPTAIAFTIFLCIAIYMTFATVKWGARYMLAMTIGAYTFTLGFAFRFALHSNPDSRGIYIGEDLLIVLSPCAFIAAEYVLLGRMAGHLGQGKYLPISPRRITLFFVLSDVSTFLIQAAGGTLTISKNLNTAVAGGHIFQAGLILQAISFLFFTAMFTYWVLIVRAKEPETWNRDAAYPWYRDWRTLAKAQFISCIGVLIRSGYRVAELSEGYVGHLATTEGFFYALDTLPLLIAVGVYVPFWPGHFIPDVKKAGRNGDDVPLRNIGP
ncbi:RTA1-like protein [Sistotremastrum niveocremeum HHB9708]|uniref:RTA1-like protein n=2 Tax=Sistotremastraceae TaxID=3402574 RepID=A0A164ZQV5_9AGAM|nr:RTA1-like protein [Sistotremastrum niveocremeum HHB9708]KZT36825.1 RTA1-domain-containing protein [Sistotremastrum suecicum HHB10207 ss-3]